VSAPVQPQGTQGEPGLAGPLGGLLLSGVWAGSPMLVARAARWWGDLARLGVALPLFLAHDVGLLYAVPREQIEIRPHPRVATAAATAPRLRELAEAYRGILAEIARTQGAQRAATLRLTDDLVVVVLARLLSPTRAEEAPRVDSPTVIDFAALSGLEARLPALFAALPRTREAEALGALSRSRLQVLSLCDTLDLDTLRLLGMLGPESRAAGALAQVDLLAALSSPAANAVVRFSLELLPGILEAHRARSTGAQAVGGYSGVGRRGSIDSMVPTELAWDDEELARRLLERDMLFYTRERAPEVAGRLHCLVIDASASMRGEREVFARGLAIALAKKLDLTGEEVRIRFFDSRLYDAHRGQDRSRVPAAWVMSFKGERGRNPARVFAQLATELTLLRAHDPRDLVVYLVSHAALHVPRPLVDEVRRLARLFGVFIVPGGGAVDLEWLDRLDGHAVVDHATLQERSARAEAATRIVDTAARVALPGRPA